MDQRETKARLRDAASKILMGLDSQFRQEASDRLCERLVVATQDVTGIVMAFLPLPDEIDLEPYLQQRLPAGVAVPMVDWNTKQMHPGLLEGLGPEDLTSGPHGVRTPVRDVPVDLKDIEVLLVPGLAFDHEGRRLGRGGGFYDRLLPGLPDRTRTIGVCFDEQIMDAIPMESWDHLVHQVMTPTQTSTAG
ncbi:MAG: 5-formyltetrahydrofolate cyclo-ligase [Planctomycetota bacterium]|nr:5-formyltetrahydrofolate cyclo-ligase [Planctomycetota bacterium]